MKPTLIHLAVTVKASMNAKKLIMLTTVLLRCHLSVGVVILMAALCKMLLKMFKSNLICLIPTWLRTTISRCFPMASSACSPREIAVTKTCVCPLLAMLATERVLRPRMCSLKISVMLQSVLRKAYVVLKTPLAIL